MRRRIRTSKDYKQPDRPTCDQCHREAATLYFHADRQLCGDCRATYRALPGFEQ